MAFFQNADAEKQHAAKSSLFWALVLTILKLVAGVATNSLGILSEALHSGLDLLAAGITLCAVRLSARPADKAHPFGYGKAESLAALAETMLLLVTCVWIVFEAVNRLFFSAPEVTPSLWGAGVIAIALVVDISRSRMLRRVAEKHNSQALEADALHFSTDVWSSAVVLLGLGGLWLATLFPETSLPARLLRMGDAVAALFVAGIVVVVSMRLSVRAVSALMDAGGAARASALEQALQERLPGCVVRRLRVREGGALSFVDMTVEAQAAMSVDAAHALTRQIEDVVRQVLPEADVTVHVEPGEEPEEGVLRIAHALAVGYALSVHNLTLSRREDALLLFLHVEAPPDVSLREAHSRVAAFERALSARVCARVVTHIEPEQRQDQTLCEALPPGEEARVRTEVEDMLAAFPLVSGVHDLSLYHLGGVPFLSLHCMLPGEMSVRDAHEQASRLEQALLQRYPALRHIIIHTDPAASRGIQPAAAGDPGHEPLKGNDPTGMG